MWIIILGMFCQLIIGSWMTWYFAINNNRIATIITLILTIIIMTISYQICV